MDMFHCILFQVTVLRLLEVEFEQYNFMEFLPEFINPIKVFYRFVLDSKII